MDWYVIQLKQKYGKSVFRKQVYELLRHTYHKLAKQVFINMDEKYFGINYYVFVQQENMQKLWKRLKDQKYFENEFGYFKIDQRQFLQMKQKIYSIRDVIGFGDIVQIHGGVFDKLYGIVLRDKTQNRFQVGIKFCYGYIIYTFSSKDLEIKGNIFKYIKVKK